MDFGQMFQAEMARHQAAIQQAESPEAWLNSNAPWLLRRYPGPNLWTAEALLAETRAVWTGASERIEQCERCPATGGACAGHRSAIPEGRVIELRIPGGELRLSHASCTRWEVFLERKRVEATELPSVLVDYPIERVLGAPENFQLASARQALYEWIDRAPMKGSNTSLLLTGGVHTDRTRVLASIVRELVRRTTRARIHYSWAPRLAVRMREHLDKRSDEGSPFERAERADYLVIDFFDPKPQANKQGWADWFLERMDGLLFERLSHGRVTVLSSPRKLEELQTILPQAGGFLAPLVVSLDRQQFGQVFG